MVDLLLGAGADVDAPDASGNTPLMMAVMFNQPAVAYALLEHGASREAEDAHGQTALGLARSQNLDALVELLEVGS